MLRVFLLALALVVSTSSADNPCAGVLGLEMIEPYVCALGQVWGIVDPSGNRSLSDLLVHADPAHLVAIYSQVGDTSLRFPIPEQIGKFTKLVELTISFGATGPIPTSIGALANLMVLNLEEAKNLGRIPSQLGQLSQLQSLSMFNSRGSGQFPFEIFQIPGLMRVQLSGGNLSGVLPHKVGNGTKLSQLTLDGNLFEGSIPSEFGLLMHLTEFSASENRLSGPIPSEIGKASRLWGLDLSNNDLSGLVPSELGALTNLERLHLNTNRFTGPIPSELGSLTSLTSLGLRSNGLVGTLPASFGHLVRLETLDVSHNRLSGPLPRGLGALVALKTLLVNDNRLSGNPEHIARWLTQLRNVAIAYNDFRGMLPVQYSRWLFDCYKSGLANLQCRVLCDCDVRKFEVEYQQADPKCENRGCMSLGWFLGASALLAIITLFVLCKGAPEPHGGGTALQEEGAAANREGTRKRGLKTKFVFAAAAVLVDTFYLQVGGLAVFDHSEFFGLWVGACALELLGAAGLAWRFSKKVAALRWWEGALCAVVPRVIVPVLSNASKRVGNNDGETYHRHRAQIAWFKFAFSMMEFVVQLASAIVGRKWDALVIIATTSAGVAVLVSWDMVLATKRRTSQPVLIAQAEEMYYQ